jgi:multiple sugar transport system substrate-binding protein
MMTDPASTTSLSRRSFIAGAGAVVVAATTPGCARTEALRVSATPSIFRAMFERLTYEFRAAHPDIHIELTVSTRGQDDQIQATLRQALIGDLPDVSFEGLPYLPVLQSRRIAVSLDDLIRQDPEWNTSAFAPSVTENASVDHSVMGLSAAVSVPIIYLNVDLVAKLWRQPIPQQWDQLLVLLDTLGQKAGPGVIGGYCQHPLGNWIYMALVESLGGSMMSPDDERITFDELPGKRALEIYEAFGRAGQARADMGLDQARQAFASGAIALLIDSSSSLTTFENQIGGRFKLGTARLPIVPDGHIPPSGVASVLLARDPHRQAAAWKFMKFVSGRQGQVIVGKTTGYFPANNLAIQRADWLGDYYQGRPLVRPIVESLPFTSGLRLFPGDNSAKIDAVISDGVAAVVTLTETPALALEAMKRNAEGLLPNRG